MDFEEIYFDNQLKNKSELDYSKLNADSNNKEEEPALPFGEYCVHDRAKNIMFR